MLAERQGVSEGRDDGHGVGLIERYDKHWHAIQRRDMCQWGMSA